MLVNFKFRFYSAGVMYEQGVQEVPDGLELPSTAVIVGERPTPVEKKAEPDTFSGMLPSTAMEKKK